ncbi:M43 family zinc metalloprotease [Bizionia arctica]|uniref:Peptidase n=1 Tax=Bizionia arctica TaxID=1495645 RepID=A0A917LK93_9FLAO|nr:M43 family zinc metalloprotease [Bizionia arctica]GGG34994.1 peptidase [Bizionia arctica]
MKKDYFKKVLGLFMFMMIFSLHAQQKSNSTSNSRTDSNEPLQLTEENQRHFNETGFVRCATVEMDELRRQKDPTIQSQEAFENWLAPLIEARKIRVAEEKANGTFRRAVVNIPIVFHVLTGSQGDTNDLSAARIQAQIDQLNIDFRNLAGSTHAAATDAEINFIPAMIDPDGNAMTEPGIDRVYGYSGTISTAALDNTIKPATIWDRSLYANIWTANLGGGLLGYAQFPSNSTLPGLDTNGGSALTDGVVILAGSVGSVANPGTASPYNLGRTLTHEVGHWIGLRHIWGDSTCGNDYCADTPQTTTSNGGCPSNQTTCDGIRDMVENYMDYTNDACMNIFTFDQVNRMVTVLENGTGISNLPNSTTGNSEPVIAFGTPNVSEVEGTSCNSRFVDISVNIGLAPSENATVTFSLSGTATNLVDYELITPNLTFNAGSNDNQYLTLAIFEDAFIENDETIIVNMSLSTTGDAELATNGSETLTYTINDDDDAPNFGTLTTLIDEDFESYSDFIIDNIGEWITLDLDELGTYAAVEDPTYPNAYGEMAYQIYNPSTTTPSPSTNDLTGASGETRNFDPHSGSKYAGSWAGSPEGGVTANNDWLISPVLSLGVSGNSVSFWVKSLSNTYGLENYNVGVYVGTGIPTSGSDFTLISASSETAPYGTWSEDTYDLSAYNNQEIRIGIHCISADRYMFMVDDFSAVSFFQNNVQTTVNTGTAASMQFSGSGDAYAFDSSSKNIMARLQNGDTFDYGCADVSVNRAGTESQVYENTDPTEFVMSKSFTINTTNTSTTGNVTASFYFTEDEIAGWETATGKSRADLYIIREVDGNVEDIVAATIGSFSTDVTLEANVSGLNGNFYFGPLNAYLRVENHAFNNFSMFPNPVTNLLTIKSGNNTLPDAYVIYNLLGQVVLSKTINNESDLLINTSTLSNGMYFIKIAQESKQISLPFIKK